MMHTTSDKKLLIVEDDAPKRKAIESFLLEAAPNVTIVSSRSLSNAISAIENHKFDIAIIDMSLPTYDFAVDKEGGGQPEGFGGSEILRFIESESPNTECIVITQYQEFSDKQNQTTKSLEQVTRDLVSEFGDLLRGVIYYSGQRGAWREELKTIIQTIADAKHDL